MAVQRLAPELEQALQRCDPVLQLRPERTDDHAFLEALYADVRHEELAPLPWPEQAKRDFLDAQCRLQREHYAEHYRAAEFLLVERAGRSIGRIYLHAATAELRLMEIALLRSERNHGIGSAVMRHLQQVAQARCIPLTLHVEPNNPAQRLYLRLGFTCIENRGVYDFLGWTPVDARDPLS